MWWSLGFTVRAIRNLPTVQTMCRFFQEEFVMHQKIWLEFGRGIVSSHIELLGFNQQRIVDVKDFFEHLLLRA